MTRARTVAHFTLDVLELFDVHDRASARSVVAGNVARDAVQIELLELGAQARVGPRVGCPLPDLARTRVALRARLDSDVRSLIRGDRCREAVGKRDSIVLVHRLVITRERGIDGRVLAQRFTDLLRKG